MTDKPIKAHLIASVGGTPGSDGKVGLVKFVREKPMTNGETDLWMAVPHQLLPYLATVAIKILPQPPEGMTRDVPHVLDAEEIVFGLGPKGELVLSLTIEKGATLSYRLDVGQAETLLSALRDALGNPSLGPPPGMKPS